MTQNKLLDLNHHLFAQIERLNDEELKGDALTEEINRAKAVTGISRSIIDNAKLGLDAEKLKVEYGHREVNVPQMIDGPLPKVQEKKLR